MTDRMEWLMVNGPKQKEIASVIDTTWHYSWYWGKEPEKRHWTMDAMADCHERMLQAEREYIKIRSAYTQLSEVSQEFYPEGD